MPSRAPGSAAGSPVSAQVVGRGRGRKPQRHVPSSLESWELREDGEHLRARSGGTAAKASGCFLADFSVGRLRGEAWPESSLWPQHSPHFLPVEQGALLVPSHRPPHQRQ